MKNSTKFLGGTLALAIITIATTASAFAYQGDPAIQGPDHSPEREAEMTQAFETNDYEAWKNLMADKGRVTQVINADNFSRFAEAHKLAEEGRLEESKAIRAELGLGQRDGSGKGQGLGDNGQKNGSGQRNKTGAKDGSGIRGGTGGYTYNN
jgi:hypothetical protein